MNRQLAEPQQVDREDQQRMAEAQPADQEVLKEMTKQLLSLEKDCHQKIVRASYSLQKMTPTDEVEAYLAAFERVATREQWPNQQSGRITSNFLSGKPPKAYFDLEPEIA